MTISQTNYFTINKKDIISLAIIGLFYFTLIKLSLLLPNPEILITPIGPAVGGALAIFLINPKRLWGFIFIILFIFSYLAHLSIDQEISIKPNTHFSNALGGFLSAWLFSFICGESINFNRMKDVLALILSAIVITAFTSLIPLISIKDSFGDLFWKYWLSIWISSGLGITVFTPLFVLFKNLKKLSSALTLGRILEFVIFLILWCTISTYMFLSIEIIYPIVLNPYMIFVLLPWVALRFGVLWVALASIAMSFIIFTSPTIITGPLIWGGESLLERLQIVQIFLGVTTTGGYLLAVSFAETRYNERHLRLLINSAFVAVIKTDLNGIVTGWDNRCATIFGWKSLEAIGRNISNLIIPENLRDKHAKGMERFLLTGIPSIINKHIESTGQHKDGHTFPIELFITQVNIDDVSVFTAFVQDITERKKGEDQLRKLSRAVEQSASTIVITDTKGDIEYVNRKFLEMTGYSFQEVIGKNPRILKSNYTPREEYTRLWKTVLAGGEWRGEFLNTKKNGEHYWESANISPIVNEEGNITHLLAVKEDITDRKKAEAALEKSLQEKELLLSEIHHRVKNNLHIVSSIISMEAHFIKDEEVVKHLNNTTSRIHAMGMLHNKLYQSIDFSKIDMNDYLSSIVEQIVSIHQFENIFTFKYDIENILMNIETAMPCGLIVNEIITNSLKYAFPQGNGEIGISIHYADNIYTMRVYDTGIGIPTSIDFNQNGRLGLKLISVLTKQLHGQVTIERENGTTYLFSFKEILKEEKRWKTQKS